MPDRLRFDIRVDPAASALRCPSLVLLTLVENAVRHGLDPSEDGGSIDIDITLDGDRCRISVGNTVATPMRAAERSMPGLGTGLTALRERLRLSYGEVASLSTETGAGSFLARVEFPAA